MFTTFQNVCSLDWVYPVGNIWSSLHILTACKLLSLDYSCHLVVDTCVISCPQFLAYEENIFLNWICGWVLVFFSWIYSHFFFIFTFSFCSIILCIRDFQLNYEGEIVPVIFLSQEIELKYFKISECTSNYFIASHFQPADCNREIKKMYRKSDCPLSCSRLDSVMLQLLFQYDEQLPSSHCNFLRKWSLNIDVLFLFAPSLALV